MGFIYSFYKHLLSGFLVPGTVLGSEDTALNKTEKKSLSLQNLHARGEGTRRGTHNCKVVNAVEKNKAGRRDRMCTCVGKAIILNSALRKDLPGKVTLHGRR